MNYVKRSGFSLKKKCFSALKSQNGVASLVDDLAAKGVSHVGVAEFSSMVPTQRTAVPISDFVKREIRSAYGVRKYASGINSLSKAFCEVAGVPVGFREPWSKHIVAFGSPYQLAKINRLNMGVPYFSRSFASRASDSESTRKQQGETRNDVSTVEDPFDAPTYNIPEKPVTFTEGASYTVIILIGLGLAAAAAYAVFKELIFEPKEYKIFGKALKRIQHDSQVSVRIGTPITGYGSESRNRAARQRIPHKTWTDEDGIEHVEVNFYIRGPHGAGKVYTEMFKDNADKQWKFTYLIVEIKSPSPAQIMLESYVPA